MSSSLSTNIQEAPQCIQVSRYLISEIQAGRLRPGEKLGSVREYAGRFQVGRQVVLSALSILLKKSLIRSESRRGYFVCDDVRSGYFYRVGFFSNRINLARNQALNQLYRMALRRGWELVPGSNYEESFELSDWLHRKSDLDGVIVTGIVDNGLLKDLKGGSLPYVVMGNYDISPVHPQVRFEGMQEVGRKLGALLVSHGMRRLVIVCGPEYLYNERFLGETLRQSAQACAPACEIEVVHAHEDSYPEIFQIMRDNPPDAFYFSGEHCLGWRRYRQRHAGERLPMVIIYDQWAEVMPAEDYDHCLVMESEDGYLENTIDLLFQQLKLRAQGEMD